MIDIAGLDKAEVLAALYNRARPQGLGFLHYTPEDLPIADAQKLLDASNHHGRIYFDYLRGRVMKVDLSKDTLDPFLYDRDNGTGAAQAIIEELRTKEATSDKA